MDPLESHPLYELVPFTQGLVSLIIGLANLARISSFYPRSCFSDYRTGKSSTESEVSVKQILTRNLEKKPINFHAPIAEHIQNSKV